MYTGIYNIGINIAGKKFATCNFLSNNILMPKLNINKPPTALNSVIIAVLNIPWKKDASTVIVPWYTSTAKAEKYTP